MSATKERRNSTTSPNNHSANVFILITFFIIRKFASISLNRHYVSKTRAQGNTSRRPMQQRVVLVALCVCSKITRNGLVIGTIDFIKVKKLWFIHYLTATDTFKAAKKFKKVIPTSTSPIVNVLLSNITFS